MAHKTEIGKDILEMLMFSLYPEAETIYREYLQNATDAIREACDAGVLDSMDDGHISIRINQSKHSVVIQDNGIGINPKDRDNVFSAFFTTKLEEEKNSGIGLYIIKKIIEDTHKGKIEFRSKYGYGSTFLITLPTVI